MTEASELHEEVLEQNISHTRAHKQARFKNVILHKYYYVWILLQRFGRYWRDEGKSNWRNAYDSQHSHHLILYD